MGTRMAMRETRQNDLLARRQLERAAAFLVRCGDQACRQRDVPVPTHPGLATHWQGGAMKALPVCKHKRAHPSPLPSHFTVPLVAFTHSVV